MSISYIQPIFAPDQKRLDRNLDSLRSFGEYTKKYPGINEVILGGWSPNEEYWTTLRQVIAENFSHVSHKIVKFDRNYGKAVVVNALSKQMNPQNKYMLTADSDIVFPLESENIFNRLIHATNVVVAHKKRDWGMIGLNQLSQNCHLPCCYENRIEYNSIQGSGLKEKMVWPTGGGGIAGGCIFVNADAWRKLGGYKVMGCYAGDDAFWLITLLLNGYSIQMIDTLGIIHPPENDEEYAKWKVKVCQRDSGFERSNIEEQVKEAEDFWKNHK